MPHWAHKCRISCSEHWHRCRRQASAYHEVLGSFMESGNGAGLANATREEAAVVEEAAAAVFEAMARKGKPTANKQHGAAEREAQEDGS